MSDEGQQVAEVHTESEGNAGKWILLLLAVIYVAGSVYFFYALHGRLDELSKGQGASNAQIAELTKRMQSAESDSEALATQLGMTKKELAERSAQLTQQQHAAEQRLAQEQTETGQPHQPGQRRRKQC